MVFYSNFRIYWCIKQYRTLDGFSLACLCNISFFIFTKFLILSFS